MAGAHAGWTIRFVQHVLAALLAYLVVLVIFNWGTPRHRGIELYLSIMYSSIILVPPDWALGKKIIIMIPIFYVVAIISPILFGGGVGGFTLELFIISGIAIFNYITLVFIVCYAISYSGIRKFSGR